MEWDFLRAGVFLKWEKRTGKSRELRWICPVEEVSSAEKDAYDSYCVPRRASCAVCPIGESQLLDVGTARR